MRRSPTHDCMILGQAQLNLSRPIARSSPSPARSQPPRLSVPSPNSPRRRRLKRRESAGGEMSGGSARDVFYADKYHPIQAGSIDGTDVAPHDNAVLRALICSQAGLCACASPQPAPPLRLFPCVSPLSPGASLPFRSRRPVRRPQGHR
jgi:hypothetical protein